MLIRALLILFLVTTIIIAYYLNKFLVKRSLKNKSIQLKKGLRYNLLLISDLIELKNLDKKEFDRSVFQSLDLNKQIALIDKLKSYLVTKHYINIYANVSDDLKRLNEVNNNIN